MINVQNTILGLLNQRTGSSSLYRQDAEKVSSNPLSQYVDVTRSAVNSGEQIINFTAGTDTKKNRRQNDYSFNPLRNDLQNGYKPNATSPIAAMANQIMSIPAAITQSNYSSLNRTSQAFNPNTYGNVSMGRNVLGQNQYGGQAFSNNLNPTEYRGSSSAPAALNIPGVLGGVVSQLLPNLSYQPSMQSNVQSVESPRNQVNRILSSAVPGYNLGFGAAIGNTQIPQVNGGVSLSRGSVNYKNDPIGFISQIYNKNNFIPNQSLNFNYQPQQTTQASGVGSENIAPSQGPVRGEQSPYSGKLNSIMDITKNLYSVFNAASGLNTQDDLKSQLDQNSIDTNYSSMNSPVQSFNESLNNIFNTASQGMGYDASRVDVKGLETPQSMNPMDFINSSAQLIQNLRTDGATVQQSSERNKQISQKPKVIVRKNSNNRSRSQSTSYKPADSWNISDVPDPTPNLGSLASQLFCTFI